jgi:outer membrane receptor protein involved in Fe transport
MPGGLSAYASQSWVHLELGAMAPESWRPADPFAAAPRLALAGATLRAKGGWSASLFVSRAFADPAANDASLLVPGSTAVNAQLARSLTRSLRVTFDAFNLLDRRDGAMDEFVASRTYAPMAMASGYLVHPGEPRGFRLGIRKTF